MKAQRNQKIEIISFMAMLCVVWWHCYCGSLCIFAPLLYLLMAWLAKTWFGKLYAMLSGGR